MNKSGGSFVKVSLLLLAMACSSVANAVVQLPRIFSDNMVLQQQAVVKLHGTAAPESKVKITPSWATKAVETKASASGEWAIDVATPAHGGPFTMTFTDKEGSLTLSNIMVGDVWVCGGQSNMEMPVRGFSGQPSYGTHDMIVKANAGSSLRLFQQPRDWSTTPRDTLLSGTWTVETPRTVGDFSVVGYVFGNYIHDVTGIPTGLIQCCWSNSRIEAWMPRPVFEAEFTDIQLPTFYQEKFAWLEGTPTLLFNAMVNPWDGFPVKGVVWYQGEANAPQPEQYKKLFPAMVDAWKQTFRNDTLAVYYVQIAPFNAGDPKGILWPEFRQVQSELQDIVPNVAMATTGDVGDSIFIHPPKKMPLAQRLAGLALEKTYGREGGDVMAPIARKCNFNPDDKTIWITFDNVGLGLVPTRVELTEFEVVDADGNIYPATAKTFGGDGVTVWSPIDNPVEVRYGFHNYYEASLFNNMFVPASPFKLKINH